MRRGLCLLAAACLAAMPFAAAHAVGGVPVVGPDHGFMARAARASETALLANRIAVRDAAQPDVRRFADAMVHENDWINRWLAVTALRDGIPAPNMPTLRERRLVAALRGAPAGQFDRSYLTAQARLDDGLIHLYRREAYAGQDQPLRAFAGRVLQRLDAQQRAVTRLAARPVAD